MLRRHSVVTTSAGKSAAELECHAEGDKPISVTWKKVSERAGPGMTGVDAAFVGEQLHSFVVKTEIQTIRC